MSRARWGRRLLAWGLVAAALAFLSVVVAENWRELRQFEWQVEPMGLVWSLLAHIGVLAWGVFVWSRVLTHFGERPIPFPVLLRIWSLSNLARYIPGTIWQFLAAAQLAGNAGLSRTLLLTSMAVHIGLVLLAASAVAVVTLPLAALGLGHASAWIYLAMPLLLLLVHPAVLNAALGILNRVLRREVLAWRGSWLDGVWLLILQVVSWLFYGTAFYLFVNAVVAVPLAALLPLAGVNALSFLAGYAVVFAPGGLGVREAAMSVLLSPFAPLGVAAVIAILSRLWTVAAELGTGALALILFRMGLPR